MAGDVEDIYPLTPVQQGMLFHCLAEPGAGMYLLQVTGELAPDVDLERLRAAWQRVVDRHQVLRTGFSANTKEGPVQVVRRQVTLPFAVEDWTAEPAWQERLRRHLADERAAGLELAKAPLLRLRVILRPGGARTLIVTTHHLVLDGWSQELAWREAEIQYRALSAGAPLALGPAPTFAELVRWSSRAHSDDARSFWRTRLAGFAATPLGVDLPAGRDRGALGEVQIALPPATSEALTRAAARAGVTPNAIVQAAWALLLARYAGQRRVLFGATVSGRGVPVKGALELLGCLINTLPIAVDVTPTTTVRDHVRAVHAQFVAMAPHETTPLLEVQAASDVPKGQPLFESVVDFVNDRVAAGGAADPGGGPRLFLADAATERTNYALTIFATTTALRLSHDTARFAPGTIERVGAHLVRLIAALASAPPEATLGTLAHVGDDERAALDAWNATTRAYPHDVTLAAQFAAQAKATPDAIALIVADEPVTYAELDRRAGVLARRLAALGVGPDDRVGVCVPRSADLVVALLGVHKAGGAYVPLDPGYPAARLGHMLDDSRAKVLIHPRRLSAFIADGLPRDPARAHVIIDDAPTSLRAEAPVPATRADHLAYVLYTSGSTGKPKGVGVTHRNVVNFLTSMDERLGTAPPRVLLALTSVSFDISVLELFWSLTRGFTVVLLDDDPIHHLRARPRDARPLALSLFYFAADQGAGPDVFRLLLEGARFADRHGFEAVWVPERHFHTFGGPYPNPAVAAAALAAITTRVQLRAGSVVSPLHDPIRIAEEWSMIDNLSGGRVGLSFASGWQPNDFVLAPDRYATRRDRMLEDLDVVRRLWRGETVARTNGKGDRVEVKIHPRPLQPELPFWLTSVGREATFRLAGERGANILTHLLGQRVEDLPRLIGVYRDARRAAGHPGEGRVTLMVHTFLAHTVEEAHARVRAPFARYLRESVDLLRGFSEAVGEGGFDGSDDAAIDRMVALAVERYLDRAGLFGTPASCLATLDRLRDAGVDEVGCLIDFGVPTDVVLGSLELLAELARAGASTRDDSLRALIERHDVGYLQCTPSFARAAVDEPETHAGLAHLRHLLVGGEALPDDLARKLTAIVGGDVVNMYGPTETTIWSATKTLDRAAPTVTLGTPIANTGLRVVDSWGDDAAVAVPGELWIGGDGVARGYVGRPELTAERFVPDPHAATPGGRAYRTGDLVRRRADGELEFLARVDGQIKLRGHRIEPGEIEAALAALPGVRECAVAVRGDGADKRLVAFVVARDASPPIPVLREGLLRVLPDYMVPAHFVALDALPLTANKKLDRRALGTLELGPLARAGDRTPPADDVERKLATVWTDVLGGELGVEDDFFELGGDSILALKLVARVRQAGMAVTAGELIAHPTVRRLAGLISSKLAATRAADPTDQLPVRRRRLAAPWVHVAVFAPATPLATTTSVERLAPAAFDAVVAAPTPPTSPTGVRVVATPAGDRVAVLADAARLDRASVDHLVATLAGGNAVPAPAALARVHDWLTTTRAGTSAAELAAWVALVEGVQAPAPDLVAPAAPARAWPRRATPLSPAIATLLRATSPDAPRAAELALAALAVAVHRSRGGGDLLVDVDVAAHDVRVALGQPSLVGPIADPHPLRLTPTASRDDALRKVTLALRQLPAHGLGHTAALVDGPPDVRRALAAARAHVAFTLALEPSVAWPLIARDPGGPDVALALDLRAVGDQLELGVTTVDGAIAPAVVDRLVADVVAELAAFAGAGATPPSRSAASLVDASIDEAEAGRFLRSLDRRSRRT